MIKGKRRGEERRRVERKGQKMKENIFSLCLVKIRLN